MSPYETKLNVLEQLHEYDHCAISTEGCIEFCKPFGLVPPTYTLHDTRDQFKGLTLDTGPGTSMAGMDAADLAEFIAKHVCGFRRYQEGRGSRLHTALDAATKALKEQAEKDTDISTYL